jgi:hypothetical protein
LLDQAPHVPELRFLATPERVERLQGLHD